MLTFVTLKCFSQNRWVYVGVTSNSNCFVSYDSETLRRNPNNTVTLWVKYEYVKAIYSSYYSKYVESEIIRHVVSCDDRTISDLSWIMYFTDATTASEDNQYGKVETIFPDTIGEELYHILCQ